MIAGVVCFSFMVSSIQPVESAPAKKLSIGTVAKETTKVLTEGVSHSTYQINSNSGKQFINKMDVSPAVSNIGFEVGMAKDKILGLETVSSISKRNDFTEGVILAGTNGDYFDSSGSPTDLTVHNGEIWTTNTTIASSRVIFGVTKEGKALIGSPDIYVGMKVNGGSIYNITGINKKRNSDQLIMYTPNYYSSTKTNSSGTEVVLTDMNGVLNGNGKVTFKVKEVLAGKGNTKLNEGEYVLSGHGYSSEYLKKNVKPGDSVEVTLHYFEEEWAGIEESIGGRYQLVKKGVTQSLNVKGAAPRTAIGIKEDGSVFMVVLDGRDKYHSVGMTLNEMAKVMKDFGAVDAMTFDGGGSSTMVVKNPDTMQLGVVNKPSDGKERSIANALFIVNKAPMGPLSKLIPSTKEVTLFSGQTYKNLGIDIKGYDAAGYPVPLDAPITWTSDKGVFNEDGSFTVNGTGKGKITATSGSISTDITINFSNKLDKITLENDVIALPANMSTPIKVKGYLNGKSIVEDPKAFTYQVSPTTLGSVKDGVFTSGSKVGTGTLTVSYGTTKATAKLIIGTKNSVVIETFEGNISSWKATGAKYKTIAIAPERKIIQYGKQSLKLSYDFTGNTGTSGIYASPSTPMTLQGNPKKIGMWVYGEGNGYWVRSQLKDANQKEINLDFTRNMNWKGWKYIEATIPSGFKPPYKLTAPVRYMSVDTAKSKGNIYVDNIAVIY